MLHATAALAVLALGLGVAGAAGYARQRSFARRAFEDLHAHVAPADGVVVHADLPEDLPPPVRRWLVRAVPDGTPIPRAVALDQDGLFRMKPGQAGADLKAHQEYTLDPPGFVWDARIRIGGLPFYGLDSLMGGHGMFSGRLAGLVQVVGGSDRTILRGSMLRFLGEVPWLPHVLALGEAVRWEAVDAQRARASLTVAGETVTGVFEFDEEDRPVRFSADRPREVDGRVEVQPWVGEYWNHVRVEGVEVPSSAKISWMLPEGPFTYWEADLGGFRFLP